MIFVQFQIRFWHKHSKTMQNTIQLNPVHFQDSSMSEAPNEASRAIGLRFLWCWIEIDCTVVVVQMQSSTLVAVVFVDDIDIYWRYGCCSWSFSFCPGLAARSTSWFRQHRLPCRRSVLGGLPAKIMCPQDSVAPCAVVVYSLHQCLKNSDPWNLQVPFWSTLQELPSIGRTSRFELGELHAAGNLEIYTAGDIHFISSVWKIMPKLSRAQVWCMSREIWAVFPRCEEFGIFSNKHEDSTGQWGPQNGLALREHGRIDATCTCFDRCCLV